MLQVTLLLTTGLLSLCVAEVFHVTPTLPATQDCPSPCYTLDQYAQNTSLFAGHTNISLVFLKGVHNLSYIVIIPNVFNNIEFQGQGPVPGDTVIRLLPLALISLHGMMHFSLVNIQVEKVSSPSEQQIAIGFYSLHIQGPSAQFINSNFRSTGVLISNSDDITFQDTAFLGGSVGVNVENPKQLSFINCTFQTNEFGIPVFLCFNDCNVLIQNSTLSKAIIGLLITSFSREKTETILNGGFTITSEEDIVQGNGSLLIQRTNIKNNKEIGIITLIIGNMTITESTFKDNRIGVQCTTTGVDVHSTVFTGNYNGMILSDEYIHLNNCTFSFNKDFGLQLRKTLPSTVLTDCTFYENQESSIFLYKSTIELRGETVFIDNTAERGGGLVLYNSTVIFGSGSNTKFINNTAQEFGGAIYIYTLPIIPIETALSSVTITYSNYDLDGWQCFYIAKNNASISFSGNKAELGGLDIYGATRYTEECSFPNTSFIFASPPFKKYQISSDPTRVCFCINNVPQCENRKYLMLNETRYPGETFTASVVLTGFKFGRVAGSVYTNVLGRGYKEVIRESEHEQTVELMECTNISYAVFGIDSIMLVLTSKEKNTEKLDEMFIDVTNKEVSSQQPVCSIHDQLGYNFSCHNTLLYSPVFINVTLETCPLGFELNESNGICECDQGLRDIEDARITCEIRDHTGYITREGTVWVGANTSENNTDIYYWHRYCQRDYCISSQTSTDLRFSDKLQCSSNRFGILCGKCQAGYSLQLGGNKCMKCNNNYLSLLIVFAILGILLVVIIKMLDLTVERATINGLIFYANIVWTNNAILFSLQDKQNIGYYVVTLPIAWINLDFGIETCFSENFDQRAKTGLQFLFPVYIWCIALVIIIISHYSIRATKLFGNNSVAVLATLFLLSYGKLFRTITDVLIYADIPSSNGVNLKVWSLDGNIQYGDSGHAVLMTLALVFLTFWLMPFTLMLFLVPFLRAKSHLLPLRWINTLKPFFDTFYGPFKHNKQHQVWTGILLISRVLILIVYASTSTSSPEANILTMTVIAALLLMYSAMVGLLYKKWSLSLLENIYIINLVLLGGAFLFQGDQPSTALSPVPTVSVFFALSAFVCTVIGHALRKVISIKGIKSHLEVRVRAFKEAQHSQESDQPVAEAKEKQRVGPTRQVLEMNDPDNNDDPIQLREILLET